MNIQLLEILTSNTLGNPNGSLDAVSVDFSLKYAFCASVYSIELLHNFKNIWHEAYSGTVCCCRFSKTFRWYLFLTKHFLWWDVSVKEVLSRPVLPIPHFVGLLPTNFIETLKFIFFVFQDLDYSCHFSQYL